MDFFRDVLCTTSSLSLDCSLLSSHHPPICQFCRIRLPLSSPTRVTQSFNWNNVVLPRLRPEQLFQPAARAAAPATAGRWLWRIWFVWRWRYVNLLGTPHLYRSLTRIECYLVSGFIAAAYNARSSLMDGLGFGSSTSSPFGGATTQAGGGGFGTSTTGFGSGGGGKQQALNLALHRLTYSSHA